MKKREESLKPTSQTLCNRLTIQIKNAIHSILTTVKNHPKWVILAVVVATTACVLLKLDSNYPLPVEPPEQKVEESNRFIPYIFCAIFGVVSPFACKGRISTLKNSNLQSFFFKNTNNFESPTEELLSMCKENPALSYQEMSDRWNKTHPMKQKTAEEVSFMLTTSSDIMFPYLSEKETTNILPAFQQEWETYFGHTTDCNFDEFSNQWNSDHYYQIDSDIAAAAIRDHHRKITPAGFAGILPREEERKICFSDSLPEAVATTHNSAPNYKNKNMPITPNDVMTIRIYRPSYEQQNSHYMAKHWQEKKEENHFLVEPVCRSFNNSYYPQTKQTISDKDFVKKIRRKLNGDQELDLPNEDLQTLFTHIKATTSTPDPMTRAQEWNQAYRFFPILTDEVESISAKVQEKLSNQNAQNNINYYYY